jgi:zinc transport system permease protein
MPWPFDRTYMQLALAAGLVVGLCAPLIGTFLVQKRMSLIGDGLGHVAFAGVAAGLLLEVAPIWAALIACVLGALAVEWLRSRGRTAGDLALALFFYAGLATGVVLLGLGTGVGPDVISFLFGSILTVTAQDVAVVGGIGAVIVVTLALMGRAITAVVIDEEWARVAGIPVRAVNAALAVLTAIIVVAAMPVVGVLLIAALMVLPVGAAQILGRSVRGTLAWGSAVGGFSVIVGLVAARIWGLAPGATIVLVAAVVFGVVALAGARRGRLPLRAIAGADTEARST